MKNRITSLPRSVLLFLRNPRFTPSKLGLEAFLASTSHCPPVTPLLSLAPESEQHLRVPVSGVALCPALHLCLEFPQPRWEKLSSQSLAPSTGCPIAELSQEIYRAGDL